MRKRDPAVQIRFLGANKTSKVVRDAPKGRVDFNETLSFPYLEKCTEKSMMAFEVFDKDDKVSMAAVGLSLNGSMASCEIPFTQVLFACETKGGKQTLNVTGEHHMILDVTFTLVPHGESSKPIGGQLVQPMQGMSV